MKKILLCSAAILGVSAVAAPAMAQVDVTVGGHTKNYLGWADNDGDAKDFDMLRESELHFNAEGTADNGLTYGFHVETEVDGGDDANSIEESYLYLSSNLGRLNLGSEDGAAYLLQVAAPSADANIDGLRQYINPFNTDSAAADLVLGGLDYANDVTGTSEKITYLSPNFSGFQAGVSYTPSTDGDVGNTSGLVGFSDDDGSDFYEAAARYEGTFNNVGFAVGGGYGQSEDSDDFQNWNVGADLDIGAFGLGAAYTEATSDTVGAEIDVDTFVVGADYTTGPFQFGTSYLNQDGDALGVSAETDRYAAGVVYTVTQGLTLRGSVQFVDVDVAGAGDFDGTSVLGGVQFNF